MTNPCDNNQGSCPIDKMSNSIITKVEKFEVSRSQKSISILGMILTVAIAAATLSVLFIIGSVGHSGFDRYFSLIISDSSYIMDNWSDFVFSTFSTLPTMGAIAIFGTLFVICASLRKTVDYIDYKNSIKEKLREREQTT